MARKIAEELAAQIETSITLCHFENALCLIHYLYSISGDHSIIRKFIPFLFQSKQFEFLSKIL